MPPDVEEIERGQAARNGPGNGFLRGGSDDDYHPCRLALDRMGSHNRSLIRKLEVMLCTPGEVVEDDEYEFLPMRDVLPNVSQIVLFFSWDVGASDHLIRIQRDTRPGNPIYYDIRTTISACTAYLKRQIAMLPDAKTWGLDNAYKCVFGDENTSTLKLAVSKSMDIIVAELPPDTVPKKMAAIYWDKEYAEHQKVVRNGFRLEALGMEHYDAYNDTWYWAVRGVSEDGTQIDNVSRSEDQDSVDEYIQRRVCKFLPEDFPKDQDGYVRNENLRRFIDEKVYAWLLQTGIRQYDEGDTADAEAIHDLLEKTKYCAIEA